MTKARDEGAAAPAPLKGVRVAELGTGPALAYCGKLFADFGASVVKVEAPGGDPARRTPPLADVGDGAAESGVFAWMNTNKESVIVAPADAARLTEIVGASDVLIDARPGAGWDGGPTGQAALRAAFPQLTIVSLSWFGESGPYRDFAATDSTLRALAGLVRNVGPEQAPALLTEHQASVPAALCAFSAAMSALLSGGGRRFEVSLLDVNLIIGEYQMAITVQAQAPERRWGINRFFPVFPVGVYQCREGWLGVTAHSPDQWRGFCDMLGLAIEPGDPNYRLPPDRLARADELDAQIVPRLLTRTAEEWFEESMRRKVPIVVVPDMAELLATEVHRARGAFGKVHIGKASFEAPILPQRLTVTPPAADSVAPLAGADTDLWRPQPPLARADKAGGLPLSGVRIVDLTMGWAGPLATRQLADLGAEVIKVEARAYPDWWRGSDYSEVSIADHVHEMAHYFNINNRNKTGITLDLTQPEGAQILRRLVRTADAVVENYSQEVLPKLGLDYAGLRGERPDMVMMSMPAFGQQSAWAEVRAYGSTLEHASGLPSVTGQAGWPPTMNHVAYGDPIGGFNACAALLTALFHRQRTGEGQFIDLAQVECLFPLVAPWLIEQSITGRVAPRPGNRHPLFVPHGCFACEGDDAWVVIAVTDDAAWRALCEAIGRADLAADPALATAPGRRAAEARLEEAIGAWTAGRSADEAMEALQARGVAAGVARGFAELMFYEPHLMARGYWQEIDRPYLGPHLQPTSAFREEGQGYPVRTPSPTLGQSTREVLSRVLGLTQADLDRLEAAQVIGETPIPIGERRPRSAALIHEAAARGDG
ncbi:MAG: CoA transferase [Caulobacterales bacterium]